MTNMKMRMKIQFLLVLLAVVCQGQAVEFMSIDILSELKDLKTLVDGLTDKLNTTERELKDLRTLVEDNPCKPDIHSELRELRAMVAEQKGLLDELRQISDKPNVAFSASLKGQGGHTLGGYNSEVILKYEKVFVNIGNAYNPTTGMFTAPIRGVYYFGFSAFVNGKHGMGVHLRKNGQNMVATYDYNVAQGDVNGSNRVVLLLEKGEQVYMGLWSTLHMFDSYNCVTTFSGFLLFPM